MSVLEPAVLAWQHLRHGLCQIRTARVPLTLSWLHKRCDAAELPTHAMPSLAYGVAASRSFTKYPLMLS